MSYQLATHQYFALIVTQIITAVLAYNLIPHFGLPGAVGVVIGATTLSMFASGLLLLNKNSKAFALYEVSDLGKCLVLFCVTAIPSLLVQHWSPFYDLFPATRLGYFLTCSILGLVGCFTILIAAHFLRIHEIRSTVETTIRRLQKFST